MLRLGFYAFVRPFVRIILPDFWLDVYVSVSLFDISPGVFGVLGKNGTEGFLLRKYGFD